MKWLTHLLTGPDNQTVDVARVLCALSVVVFLGLTVYSVIPHKGIDDKTVCGDHWDMQGFGVGLAAVLSATGAFIKLKENSEPKGGA